MTTATAAETSSGNINSSGLAASMAKFNSKLLQEIGGKTAGNIFYSPVSLHAVLSQLLLGSPKNSSTYAELVEVLHLDNSADADIDDDGQLFEVFLQQRVTPGVKIVNRLYVDQSASIMQEFTDGLIKYFKSTIEQEDFSNPELAVEHINKFVSDQTNGLIPNLLMSDSIQPSAKLFLINVIYFKGMWKQPFNSAREAPFFVNEKKTTMHMSMEVKGVFKTTYFDLLQSNLLALPYADEKTAMVIILPDVGFDVLKVEEKLVDIELGQVWEVLNSGNQRLLNVGLPKFQVSHDHKNLKEVLNKLGLVTMFDGSKADFSRISGHKDFSVSDVVQKAVIKVDEEGSEAAAATYLVFRTAGGNQSFTVNRPFIFYIYDIDNNLPLFVGRIVDPNEGISQQGEDLD